MTSTLDPSCGPAPVVDAGPGTLYPLHPLEDPRWGRLVERHPHSSAFHTVAWLEALRKTYGYQPVAFTTAPPSAELSDGVALCRVGGPITGRRLISLPFSDHCEVLSDLRTGGDALVSALRRTLRGESVRYVELRSKCALPSGIGPNDSTEQYCFHSLDLRPDLAALFHGCHKACTQRKITRAEREGLVCRTGRSEDLLEAFWGLFLMTRRRHGVPPQPKKWFHNLIHSFGDALNIRVAFKDDQPAAAILTLRHKDVLMYKYGCSDTRFNSLGGTQLLFWNAIQEGKREGMREFDLGRSDLANTGLILFKDRLGGARSMMTYRRCYQSPPARFTGAKAAGWALLASNAIVPYLSDGALSLVGSALYRYFA